jgi:hypothetical protein
MRSVDHPLFFSLRRQTRKLARSSPFWKDYKRRRRARPGGRNTLPQWAQKWVWLFVLLVSVPALATRLGVLLLLALLAIYCSATVFLRVAGLHTRLYSSLELYVALHYPVSDETFFRWQVRGWLASLLPLIFISGFIYYWTSRNGPMGPTFWAAAALAGALQALSVAALSLASNLYIPSGVLKPGLVLYVVMGLVIAFPAALGDSARTLVLFLPAGWINALFSYGLSHSQSGLPSLAIAFGAFAIVDYRLLQSLRASFPRQDLTALLERPLYEEIAENDPRHTPTADLVEPSTSDYHEVREHFAAAHNRSRVESLIIAPLFDWESADWRVRLAGRLMTPRERIVVAFLRAGTLGVSIKRWHFTAAVAAGVVLICLLPLSLPFAFPMVLFLMAAISSTPVLGGSWPGLSPAYIGFMRVAPAVGYPISFREASLAIAKCNAPFFLGFFPYALLMGAAMGWRYLGSVSDGVVYSAQILLLLLTIQPYCTILLHSQATNDTRGFNLTSLSLMGALILNILVFLPAVVLFFIGYRQLLAWIICPFVMIVTPLAMWRFYEFLYNRGRIDLLAAAR